MVRVMVEQGKKKVVAVAFDWPGWERVGKTEAAALEALEAYRPRYAVVADLAGQGEAFAADGPLQVVERRAGTSTTDFFGISTVSAAAEAETPDVAECERKIALLRSAWATFDATWPAISAALRKGRRGSGRDRDQVVRHTIGSEPQMAKKVGVVTDLATLRTPAGLAAHRDAFVEGIRAVRARGGMARTWTLQFVIRRSCYHVLDHLWELEDKDLTGQPPG